MLNEPADSAREIEVWELKCCSLNLPFDNLVFQLSELEASQDAIIGYVTSGNFSLSIGQGQAIGAIPVAKFLHLTEQSHR